MSGILKILWRLPDGCSMKCVYRVCQIFDDFHPSSVQSVIDLPQSWELGANNVLSHLYGTLEGLPIL